MSNQRANYQHSRIFFIYKELDKGIEHHQYLTPVNLF
jgi:hypothetical protein